MQNLNFQYVNLIDTCLKHGIKASGRNGVFSSVFGEKIQIAFQNQFQMIKVRHLNLPLIVDELKWFLSGSTDIPDNLKSIWQPFTHNSMPNQIYSYGYAIRTGGGDQDQWMEAIEALSIDDGNRQIVIDLWQPWYNPKPCHLSICLSRRGKKLFMSVTQRSADNILGLPWDITQYTILLFLIAEVLHLEVDTLTWFIHDGHLYENHRDIASSLLQSYLMDCVETRTSASSFQRTHQELVFRNVQQSKEELIHEPWKFDLEFPNYDPIMKVKIPYNV